jgi:glycosyltransferase involved in cell wall biosynthesis
MSKPRVALLTNMIAPNRVALFRCLGIAFDLSILYGGREANRTSWKDDPRIENVRTHRVWGWQFSMPRMQRGKHFDRKFIHIQPGYLTDLLRQKPQAVISIEMGFRTLIALAYGSLFRKPVWVWWGGTLITERGIGVGKKLLRFVIARWAKNWMSYGKTSTEYLTTLGISPTRILEVQNSVDETQFGHEVQPALAIQPKPTLLHVGQMIARKGVAELLKAAAHVQGRGIEFSLVLVGDGPDTAELKQLAIAKRLKNVHFYAAQPPEVLPSFYRSADMLIFPTMEDVWGLVANEALLSGLPVLCSKYAGCAPELFERRAIFDPANEDEFAEALHRAVEGRLPGPVPSRLVSTQELAKRIADAVLSSIRTQSRPSSPAFDSPSVGGNLKTYQQ